MVRSTTTLLAIWVSAWGGGCKNAGQEPGPQPPQDFIAFVGAGAADPLWPILRNGAERFPGGRRRLGTRFLTPPIASPQEQVGLIRGLLGDLRLKGLCVQVIDPQALISVLEEAAIHGVPVVTMIRDVPAHLRIAYCGVDQADIGRKLADATYEALDGKGNVEVLVSTMSDPYYAKRLRAFQTQIGRWSGIHILAYAECHGDSVAARRELRNRSRRYPSIRAWVMLDNWAFNGWNASQPLVPKRCRVIAVDPFPANWKRLESGECYALIGGEYGEIGYEAMRRCHLAVGSPVRHEMESLVPALLIRASELADFRIRWTLWSSPDAAAGTHTYFESESPIP
jgi:ABC-type sugar transport system substrate-binding protein